MEWTPDHDSDTAGEVEVYGRPGEHVAISILDGVGNVVGSLGTVTIPTHGEGRVPFPVSNDCPGIYPLRAQSTTTPSRSAIGSITVWSDQSSADSCIALGPWSPGRAPSLSLDMNEEDRVVYPYRDGFLDTTSFVAGVAGVHYLVDQDSVDAKLTVRAGAVSRTTPVKQLSQRYDVSGLPFGTATAWLSATAPDGTEVRSNTETFEIRRTGLVKLGLQSQDVTAHPWADTRNRTEIVAFEASGSDHDVSADEMLRLTGVVRVYGPHAKKPLKVIRFADVPSCRIGFVNGPLCRKPVDHRLQFVPAKHGYYVAGRYRVTASFRAQEGPTLHATSTFRVQAGKVLNTKRVR